MNQRGKILRVKTGYNPNSSSIGTHIPAFIFSAIASGVFAVIAMQTLNTIETVIRKRKDSLTSDKKE
ncbi:MAG: hypothetical protein A2Y10_06530 [Planctomycetes bacterium GWF2_41_51]|nr:MAG: hypothetical protein A2Y10_06530 [Planctomycetes bacterium GWF2_41_51]HBG28121.1 hypothetical protein [Phycisphaerales bacterium]